MKYIQLFPIHTSPLDTSILIGLQNKIFRLSVDKLQETKHLQKKKSESIVPALTAKVVKMSGLPELDWDSYSKVTE